MILVDTSIWINFLKDGNKELRKLLLNYQVLTHEYIIGELIAGNIKNRVEFISLLKQFKRADILVLKKF